LVFVFPHHATRVKQTHEENLKPVIERGRQPVNKIGFLPTKGNYETGYFNPHSDQSWSKLHGVSE
jgi:hypothetical protein